MNHPFNNNTSLKRLLVVGCVLVLCAAFMAGCFGKKDSPAEPNLNLEDPTTTSETTEATIPTTTAPKKENMAVVKEQLRPRGSPSLQASEVDTVLEAGDEVQVLRIETLNGTQWAYSKQGWILVEQLDMTNVSLEIGSIATPNNPAATDPTTSATTPESNANNNTATGNTTGTAKMGIVTGNGLNVRKESNTTSDVVTTLSHGTRVTINEVKNGWGKIDKGWISLQYVYMDGDTSNSACKGIVLGSGLNVRSGPGTNYGSVATLNKNDRVNILFRIKMGDYTWGCISSGWIRLDYVYIDGTEGTGSGTGYITGDAVNVRGGPGTKYDVVGSYKKDDEVKILAQFTFGDYNWGCTNKGWVRMDFVNLA